MVHERSGETAAANVGVRLDRLEPRQRRAGRDEAHLRHERAVEEGAEPRAVTRLDERPVARHPRARRTCGGRLARTRRCTRASARRSGTSQRRTRACGRSPRRSDGRAGGRRSPSSRSTRRRPARGRRTPPGRRRSRAEHRIRSSGAGRRAAPSANRSSHISTPVGCGHVVEQQEVAPVEGRVGRAADDEVIAAVLDRRPGTLEEREVGAESEGHHVHAASVVGAGSTSGQEPSGVLQSVRGGAPRQALQVRYLTPRRKCLPTSVVIRRSDYDPRRLGWRRERTSRCSTLGRERPSSSSRASTT